MKILLLLLLPFQTLADTISVGTGSAYRGSSNQATHLAYRTGKWKVSLDNIEEYKIKEEIVEKHYLVSLTKTLIKKENFHFNFGISYSDKVSSHISSNLVFKEELALEYGDFTILLSHNSNAGLKGKNRGEDTLYLVYTSEF